MWDSFSFVFYYFQHIVGHASVLRTDDEVFAVFEEWMVEHGKVYNGLSEKADRFEIFKDNLKYIENHNSLPNQTYELGLNKFSDLTDEEFESIYLGNPIDVNESEEDDEDSDVADDDDEEEEEEVESRSLEGLPASVDWRSVAVVPIKDQGKCGSCWAFSTIATVEALNKIYNGKLVSLSEQMLVDCVSSNNGCKDGRVENAFKFIKWYGIASSKDYPYKAVKGQCQKKKTVLKISGFKWVIPQNERGLLRAVASRVVSVGVKAGSKDFQQYKSGIFSGKCGDKINHVVNVVGYGAASNGKSFWILRNSWGLKWGEKGYMRIVRNVPESRGHCGIAASGSFPVKSTFVNQELLSIL